MTSQGSVVSKLFVLDHFLAGADSIEEVRLVINYIAIAFWRGIDFRRLLNFNFVVRVFLLEVGQILVAQFFWPSINRVAFRLRTRVLRGVSQILPPDDRRSLGAVEADEVSLIIHQIAAQVDSEIRILVKRLNQIWIIAAILKVETGLQWTALVLQQC